MSNHLTGLQIAAGILVQLIIIIGVIKSRYRKFTSREYVLRYRNGQLISEHRGGGFFLLPLIDELVIISTAEQRVDFSSNQEIVFKPNFAEEEFMEKIDSVQISGFLTYQVTDFKHFYSQSTKSTEQDPTNENLQQSTKDMIADIVESHLKSLLLEQPLDKIFKNRSFVKESILEIVGEYQSRLGIIFEHLSITDIIFHTE